MDLPKFTSNKKKGEGFEEFGEKLSFSKILIVTLVWRLKSYSLHIEMSGLVSTLSSKFKKNINYHHFNISFNYQPDKIQPDKIQPFISK